MGKSSGLFKNLLMTDTPYLRDEDSLRGCSLVSFISLIAYYRILSLLKKKGINERISVKDAILQLSEIYPELQNFYHHYIEESDSREGCERENIRL